MRQQALDDAADGGENRLGQPGVGIDAGVGEPVARQVQPAAPRILANVAGDVGDLHGHAEVAGAREHRRIARAHEHGHHRADRARDARRVASRSPSVCVAAAFQIPREASSSAAGSSRGIERVRHHFGKGAVGRDRQRLARVDQVEPRVQQRKFGATSCAEIDGIVGLRQKA